MISLISSLSLKLYLNSLVYHRNMFGSSSKVFGHLRTSSNIFGNFRKLSENVWERSSGLRNNFGKSWETFVRWSEIFGKSSKTPSSACLENKIHIFAPPCTILYIKNQENDKHNLVIDCSLGFLDWSLIYFFSLFWQLELK